MCGPRSLRIRMWMGICPPSKFGRLLVPEREPAPFWPRPDVLPVPELLPRPMRLRVLREPGAGLRECRPMRSVVSSAIGDLHEMADAVQHAPRLLVVLDLDRVADAAQAERAQRVELALVRAVARLDLRHLHSGFSSAAGASGSAAGASSASAAGASASASGSAAGASAAGSVSAPLTDSPPSGSLVSPSTALTDRPRSSATSSGRRSCCSPVTVALTRLIGFWVPSDLLRMSWIPASSSTARTPPPAMTPVPGEAGLRNTRPEP